MEILYITFLVSVILFCMMNLVYLFTIRHQKLELDEVIIPKPYQPPTEEKKSVRREELPIHRDGDWVYDPNVNYRPRQGIKTTDKKLTNLG